MVMLVSLAEASEHLRRDTTDDDADLTIKIQAASQAVLNYIDEADFVDSSGEVPIDSSGEPIGIPYPLKAAVLLIIGDLYADRDQMSFREGDTAPRIGDIIQSRTVHFLLDPYRTPLCQ